MSLIEQAAKRLEELRRAGADVGDAAETTAPLPVAAEPERVPTPEAALREINARRAAAAAPVAVAPAPRAEARPEPARQPAAPAEDRPAPLRLDIDLARLKMQGLVTPDAPRSQIADEFRVIKRPIVRNAFGRAGARVANGNLVMVTSSLPGEGKTFTAINLALSVAMELDTTVLLVDGDVAHPDFPDRLGVRRSPGLLELLTRDDIDVADVLVRTNIENLSIIPAGASHHRATELLASEQMTILLRELASRYPDRMIVFDSPPLLATTEARVLATHMGQIVMVVAADHTRQRDVDLALATIENCEVVLMVLNKAEKTDVGAYYGYYGDEPRSA
jgi:receptor protein-tyrosine kinase